MPPPRLDQRIACRERPRRPALMAQTWSDLLFAHWEVDPVVIQATLPAGLTVDTHNGRAYLGLIPFHMRNIRPTGLPPVPWLSYFLEMNVRTYVHDQEGLPGVWFYSLDCSQPVAVWLARTQFGLPYFHARMTATRGDDGSMGFNSHRRNSKDGASFTYRREAVVEEAIPDTLEFFLLERYYLYSIQNERLLRGQVHHRPYPLSRVTLHEFRFEGLLPGGICCAHPPIHWLASSGVDVEVFSPEFLPHRPLSPSPRTPLPPA